jgi:hypothetical protein
VVQHELELGGNSDDDDDDVGDGFRTLSPERLPKSLVLTESGNFEEREETAELMESASSIVFSERDDDDDEEEEDVLSDIDTVVREKREGGEGGEGGESLRSALALVGNVLEEVTRTRLDASGGIRLTAQTSPVGATSVGATESPSSSLVPLDLSREDETMLEDSFKAATKELAEKQEVVVVHEMETMVDPEEMELQRQIQEAEERLRFVFEKEEEKNRRNSEMEEILDDNREAAQRRTLIDQQAMSESLSESLRRGVIV